MALASVAFAAVPLSGPWAAAAAAAPPDSTCPEDYFCLFSGPHQTGDILYRSPGIPEQEADFDPPIHPWSYQYKTHPPIGDPGFIVMSGATGYGTWSLLPLRGELSGKPVTGLDGSYDNDEGWSGQEENTEAEIYQPPR
ncbi:hypothetical protein EBO15_29505 [Actinomadura harenae]|uniref:Peptidase inhibitor family I36 protein n=2 Tax=Actinomadura harenae TaxID=2483351 RepID=A0A3M2LX12_9ACTN|nr:hypothetical protein EBO15_29505 [Actinomadura harenae]